MTNRKNIRYPYPIKLQALQLFQQGLGYRIVAKELDIPLYTVRYWHRKWNESLFDHSKKTYTEALIEILCDNDIKEISRMDKGILLDAYMKAGGDINKVTEKIAIKSIISAISQSSRFVKYKYETQNLSVYRLQA